MKLIIRHIQPLLQSLHARPRGRLLVLTGARQCGKTTLASMAFPDYPVISLDAPVERVVYAEMSPADWLARFPQVIFDEIQKLPELVDTVKACHDRDQQVRQILLGSSQLLLLKRVRESLAGRAAVAELYPFLLPELAMARHGLPSGVSRLQTLLVADHPAKTATDLFSPAATLTSEAAILADCWNYYLRWGGMPRIADPAWSDEDRFQWLRDYQNTYLQRDLGDIARLDRLEPFCRAQRAVAGRTAQPVNFSEVARLAGVSPPTAREFLRYLEISYQVILLPPWHRNPEKRLAKQPKLHFLDPGVRRAIIGLRGEPNGAEFESAVVSEIYKCARTFRLPVDLHHLRTSDGREVDLLIERPDGFIAIECKQTANPQPTDTRHLRNLGDILDKPLLLGLVACAGHTVRTLGGEDAPLLAVPAHLLLG